MTKKNSTESTVREIRIKTRKKYSAEEKIRIVLDGIRGEDSIAELCRREGIHANLYYKWSKEFLEAGKQRLAGDIKRQTTSPEVSNLRQEIVNNFVSGLILLFERPVKVGDAVIIDGKWEAITKIGMRSTVVETWDRSELIVPNSQMISEKVLNWTLTSNVSRITVKVGVKYGTDLGKVIKILNKVGDGHPSVVSDPPPSAIFTDFGDSSINFELRVWVDDIKNRLTLISDLGVAIDKAFKKSGVEIPFPQRDLHLKSVSPDAKLPE